MLDRTIKESFANFITLCESRYHLNSNNYSTINGAKDYKDRHTLNPFLTSEDDIKVKFGGLLEQKLLSEFPTFTVHSELSIYGKRKKDKVDLSIHQVDVPSKLWFMQKNIDDSLKAAIEIKYSSYRTPYFELKRGSIEKDIIKLNKLGQNILTYLLILDEGNKLSRKDFINFKAGEKRVTILSNNPSINTFII